ncbi:MAG: response regulator transcription factor [Anaerolineales bacterium]|nr:response regulator transcription factor [Anaerolineales bacterium]
MDEILVIGEHELVRKAICERLKMVFPAYHILGATAGKEAIDPVLQQPVSLVVIDIDPPTVDRLKLVRHIKSVRPKTPIVVWSVHDWENYRTDALAAGAAAYVSKREPHDKLLAIMVKLLSADEADPPTWRPDKEGGNSPTAI